MIPKSKVLKINYVKAFSLFLVLLLSVAHKSNGEGTKQVIPPGTAPTPPSILGAYGSLALTTGTTYSSFANYNATEDYRLYIHISSTSEKILFGFQKETPGDDIRFNIHAPTTPFAVVFSGTVPSGAGTGYIADINQAYAGPFPASGGYTPFEYVPTATGDYFIEFYGVGLPPFGGNVAVAGNLKYFDITVLKTGYQTPPVPTDAQDGRVWSKSWQFNSPSINVNDNRYFAGNMFVYSTDGIVTKIDFNNMIPGTFMVFCNPKGVQNLTDPIEARKSRTGNYKYPDFKVFLNDPDITAYPNGTPGTISTSPAPTMTPADPPCSGNENIIFSVSQDGKVDITLELPAPYSNRIFTQTSVAAGSNTILWDGLDGGTPPVPVQDGTPVTMTINYLNGLTNLPLYDVEYTDNTNFADRGLKVTLVRPTTGVQTPRMYWDDGLINPGSMTCPGTININPGCLPSVTPPTDGCHKWKTCLGNVNTINTWWYAANSSAAGILVQHNAQPPDPVGVPANRCGPGTLTINATVLNGEVADWYSDAAGTLLVQAGTPGNTGFTTPVLTATATYYVRGKNPVTGCTSTALTPVLAEIFDAPAPPTGTTTVSVCNPQSVSLTAIVGTGLTVEWWDAPAGGNSLGTNATYVTPVLGTGTHLFYAEAVAIQPLCSRSPRTTFTVNITSTPVITLVVPPSSICTGANTNLDLSTTFSSTVPGTTYTWSILPGNCTNILVCPPGGTGTLLNDLLMLSNPILPGQVLYDITPSANGCSGNLVSITVPVAPYPAPAGPLSPVIPVACQGQTTLYSVAPVPNATNYLWSVTPPAAALSIAINPAANYEADITWDATYTGAAVVHVKGQNSCGEGAESVLPLTIQPKPQVAVKLCEDIVTSTEGRFIKMKWGLPLGGEYSGPGVSAADKLTFDPKNSGGPGIKTITYTYTNQVQCSNTATVTILIKAPPAFAQCGISALTDVRTNLTYPTYQIGNGLTMRCWMAKNLDFGTMLLNNIPQTDNCMAEKYCMHSDLSQCANYGALYQWNELMQYEDAAMNYKDLCPPGWHVPSEADWLHLISTVPNQQNALAGGYLKAAPFQILLDGLLYLNQWESFDPAVPPLPTDITATILWTSTRSGAERALSHGMNNIDVSVSSYSSSRANALPVRCVKD